MLQGTREEKGKEESGSLEGRKLYVPRMDFGCAKLFCAAFNSLGIDAHISPESDERTLEIGAKYLSGDECYPQKVTLGNFFKVIERDDFDPKKVAFFMPTADGPCRYGQYQPLLKNILKDRGLSDVSVIAPTSENSYGGIAQGKKKTTFVRLMWRALVVGDLMRKLLLKTRPYEINKGETDALYNDSLNRLYDIFSRTPKNQTAHLVEIVDGLIDIRQRFRRIEADYSDPRPLIGVVGEIFCRLNNFSNDDLCRKIEEHGGETWLSDLTEWIWYTNNEHEKKLVADGKRISFSMMGAKLKHYFQKHDEHRIFFPFKEDIKGYEEPHHIKEVLDMSWPYLPHTGALGEMTLSVGKAIYLYSKGADGIVDISPFTCMNGIVSEAVYPSVSRDHDNIPIRNFYFDGTQQDLDRDVGIFMELARGYRIRKKTKRTLPRYFTSSLPAQAVV